MAFGFCLTSTLMPSEEGIRRVSEEKSAVLFLSPRRSTCSRK
jgi:hypothetical protein